MKVRVLCLMMRHPNQNGESEIHIDIDFLQSKVFSYHYRVKQ